MRNSVRAFAAAATILAVALIASACGGGDDSEPQADSPATEADGSASANGEPAPEGKLELEAGETAVEIIGEPIELPNEISDSVIEQTQRYVDLATIDPLLGNDSKDDIQDLFFFTVADNVAEDGADRGALTDEALPKAEGDLETSAQPVMITALSNGFGGWVMVAATIDYSVSADVTGGPVTIQRSGDLYFTEHPETGEWQISAYDIGVARITDDGTSSDAAENAGGTPETDGEGGSAPNAENSEETS